MYHHAASLEHVLVHWGREVHCSTLLFQRQEGRYLSCEETETKNISMLCVSVYGALNCTLL